jgi:ribonuclease P protein subunit POP4
MKRTVKNLIFHEIIGLKVKIIKHSDPSLEGVEGIVTWETTRSLRIKKADGRNITVTKLGGRFLFYLNGKRVLVEGENILGDPIERVKRLR